jgi:hypothetical protein
LLKILLSSLVGGRFLDSSIDDDGDDLLGVVLFMVRGSGHYDGYLLLLLLMFCRRRLREQQQRTASCLHIAIPHSLPSSSSAETAETINF